MKMHEHPEVVAARERRQRIEAELSRFQGRLDQARDNTPRPDEHAQLARRLLGEAPQDAEPSDPAFLERAIVALRRELAEARLAEDRAELTAQRAYVELQAAEVEQLDRDQLDALERLLALNERRAALNAAAQESGFDPVTGEGVAPDLVAGFVRQARRAAMLEEAARSIPDGVARVRVLVAAGGHDAGDVADVPAAEARRLVREGAAEVVPRETGLFRRIRDRLGLAEPTLE